MKAKQPDNQLIRSSFVRMLFVNMFVQMTINICGVVDSLVISHRLGTEALAAVGFFSPVSMAFGMFSMIVIGSQILIGNYIGAGKKERIDTLFFSSFLVLGVAYTLLGIAGILFRDGLATLLGARGETHALLCDYMLGYLPGIPLQALSSLMMALVFYNNDIRRSYLAAGVMAIGNLLADLLLVGMGTAGIGLASTASYAAGFLILLPGYLKKDRTVHLMRARMDLRELGAVLRRGLPALLFTLGLVAKNALMNIALSRSDGDTGIAMANVLFSVCGIVGIFSGGCSTAYSSLAGICYGEQDREGFRRLFRSTARIGIGVGTLIVAALMCASSLMAGLFFRPDFTARAEAQRMFLLGFTFFPVNIMMNLLMSTYQAQGKMRLVNILSVAETATVGLFAFLAVPAFGLDAAWLGNTVVDIGCLGVIIAAAAAAKGKAPFRTDTLLRLDKDFGAAPEDCMETVLRSGDGICEASKAIVQFCGERDIDRRTSMFAGLCVEEMARNIFRHGRREKNVCVEIRAVARDGLTIRIRDNCIAFDPRKRIDQYYPEDPEKNIGIRLTASIAKQIDYYNNAGVNTLIIKM